MKPSARDPESSIPTSSMADIAFLLIIFFMVTTVFAATKGLELQLPAEKPSSPDATSEDAVFIHVRTRDVLVDCRPMQASEIRGYLEPILSRNPEKPVILYTESDAEYQAMISVYEVLVDEGSDDARGFTGVRNIFVPTASDIEGYAAMFGYNPLQSACL